MQQDKTTILIFLGIMLIIGLIGELLIYNGIIQIIGITRTSFAIGRIVGLILILKQGNLIKIKQFYLAVIFFLGLILAGAIMKIMHWPFANLIIVVGLIGIPAIYAIHFFKKKSKKRLDLVKFVWVTFFYLTAIFTLQHYPFNLELKTMEDILFLLLFADFAYNQFKEERQQATMEN